MKKPTGKLAAWLGISVLALAGLVFAVSSTPPATSTPAAVIQATNQQAPIPVQQAVTSPTPVTSVNTSLSNNNYYTNVNGNTVHSPAYSSNGDIPAGATAECGDGTYSFSQHHSGTCSHHGGVSQWLQ